MNEKETVSEIQRWMPYPEDEAPDGWPHDFVATADHVAALAEQNAAWVARLEKLAGVYQAVHDDEAEWLVHGGDVAESIRSLLKEVDDGE